MAISSAAGTGLPGLLYKVKDAVVAARTAIAETEETNAVPVITLDDTANAWRVSKQGDTFMVTGHKIERFAARTDFANEEAVQRLRDIMRKMGIMHKLLREGSEPGMSVRVGGAGQFIY